MNWIKKPDSSWANRVPLLQLRTYTWQIRFSTSSSILIVFSALFTEVHKLKERAQIAFCEPLFPISLRCDMSKRLRESGDSPNLIIISYVPQAHSQKWIVNYINVQYQYCYDIAHSPLPIDVNVWRGLHVKSATTTNHSTPCTDILKETPPSATQPIYISPPCNNNEWYLSVSVHCIYKIWLSSNTTICE